MSYLTRLIRAKEDNDLEAIEGIKKEMSEQANHDEKVFKAMSKKDYKETNLMKGRSDLKKKGDKYTVDTDLNIKKNLDPKVKKALKKSILEEVNERLKGSGFNKIEFSSDEESSSDEETEGKGFMINNVEQFTPSELRHKKLKDEYYSKKKFDKEYEQKEKEKERILKSTAKATKDRLKESSKKPKIDKRELKNYSSMLKHLLSHIEDPKEPVDKKDYKGAKKLIDDMEIVKRPRGRPRKN